MRIAAGLHVPFDLTRSGLTEDDIRAVAERERVALGFLAPNWHDDQGRFQGLIVGYARPPAMRFDEAMQALAAILTGARSG